MGLEFLYVFTAIVAGASGFAYLHMSRGIGYKPKFSLFFPALISTILISPFLTFVDFSKFGSGFYLYMFLSSIFRIFSLTGAIKIAVKTSAEKMSAVNPTSIFISFLIFSIIDYQATINLINYPFKFYGILSSIFGLIMVLIWRKRDNDFFKVLIMYLPVGLTISLSNICIRMTKGYLIDNIMDYDILANFMMFFIITFLLFFSEGKRLFKNGFEIIRKNDVIVLVLYVLAFFSDRLFMTISYAIADNPGYALAIKCSVLILISIYRDAFINAKKENSIKTILGILIFSLSMIYFVNL